MYIILWELRIIYIYIFIHKKKKRFPDAILIT